MMSEGTDAGRGEYRFLVRAGELLHQHGTPSYRLERVMQKIGQTLDIETTVLCTPTALLISLRDAGEEKTFLRRITNGDVDVSKLMAFDAILDQHRDGQLTWQAALEALERAADDQPAYTSWQTAIASAVACGSVATIFGGGLAELLTAALLGFMLAMLTLPLGKMVGESGLLEPIWGMLIAALSLIVAQYVWALDDRLVTLAALILPVPGLTLTIALTELALGHLSSGSARLAGAAVRLITLVIGVAIAWNVWPDGMHAPAQPPYAVSQVPPAWWLWPALLLAPLSFVVLFRVPLNQWAYVLVISVGGFLINRYLDMHVAPAVGSFCGAFAVGCGSNLYARALNRPAMAMQTPGLLILVPGALGYRSLTAMLASDTIAGVELAFAMILTAGSLVGGLLIANLMLPPKRIL